MSADNNFRHAQTLITEARDLIIDGLPPSFGPTVLNAFQGLLTALDHLAAFLETTAPTKTG